VIHGGRDATLIGGAGSAYRDAQRCHRLGGSS
jgi:hypothetical protein